MEKEIGVPLEKINVDGGTLAMGNPGGALGGMELNILLDGLERTNKTMGVVALNAGAGMGIASVIERI